MKKALPPVTTKTLMAETGVALSLPKGSRRAAFPRAWKLLLISSILLFPFAFSAGTATAQMDLDFSAPAVKRGERIFKSSCQGCHSLKYLNFQAQMKEEDARRAFGKAPPDLSLTAKARGRGSKGAAYIKALLVSFNESPEKNSVFPGIAMPPSFSGTDPELMQKANDVAAFLLYAAEPAAEERKTMGGYVLGYMAILTALLFLLNRETWKTVK